MGDRSYDVVIVGSGAGGGVVAQRLAALAERGGRILLLEKGARFDEEEFTGHELEMAPALYEDSGGFLTADGTMTLALGRAYGGSTVVYTGTSLVVPERVIRKWGIPGLEHTDVKARTLRYMGENNVHYLDPAEINDNNRLFVEGCRATGYEARQFPVNVKGCRGSSLCNLGCPNAAKQGTHRVQLPRAEAAGVEVVTRAEVRTLSEGALLVEVSERPKGGMGRRGEWEAGTYRVRADHVVLCGGAVGTPALLLRSGFRKTLPRLGEGFTCHPALILVGEHPREITNDVGHPKSYYLDRAEEEGFVLETCMYFPFTTAKNITGFGPEHRAMMRAFPRLQMILVLACDEAEDGNRITVDRAGTPVVHYRFTEEVIARLTRANRAAARIFFGAGAARVHAPLARPHLIERADRDRVGERIHERWFVPGTVTVSAAHPMGGCGMGSGPVESVTDSRGRVHGHPWLRVADASLFPDSLEINPYLTVMAMADRVAQGLLEEVGERFGSVAGGAQHE
jgi:choline dehydrogenase-like flavoprotein